MTSPFADRELIRAEAHAADVVRVAHAYGYALPDGWEAAHKLAAAARKLASDPGPAAFGTLPHAADVAAWCAKRAAERDEWRGRTTVAKELVDRARIDETRLALSAAEPFAVRLAEDVNKGSVARLVELLGTAPRTLTGHETEAAMAAHAELLRTVAEVTNAVRNMGALYVATGEAADLGVAGVAFVLIDPPDTASFGAVTSAVATLSQTGVPTDADGYDQLVPLRLSLAAPGQTAQRLARYNTAASGGMGLPDGGIADRSMGERLAAAHGRINPAMAASQ